MSSTRVSKKLNLFLIITALITGALFDYFFYATGLGLSYPLFVAFAIIAFFFVNKKVINFKSLIAWFLVIIVLALSTTFALFSNDTFLGFNFLLIPFLYIVMTLIFTENHKYQWHDLRFFIDLFPDFFIKILESITPPFRILKNFKPDEGGSGKGHAKNVIWGVLASIPILILIIFLLSSADEVFKSVFGGLPKWLNELNWGEGVFQFVLVLVVTVFFASLFWALLHRDSDFQKNQPIKIVPNTNSVFSATFLSLINLVYLLFVVIQFSYLFNGGDLSFLDNFTYAEYAKRGFGELIVISVLNLTILIGVITLVKYGSKKMMYFSKFLLSLLVVSSFIVLYSANFRLSLYEQAYGYTLTRVFGHLLVLVLGALLLSTLYKAWNHRASLIKMYIIIMLSMYAVFNFSNVDKFIIEKNIDRYHAGEELDLSYYCNNLSYDIVPALVSLQQNEAKLDPNVSSILRYLHKSVGYDSDSKWQAYNLSKFKAQKAIEASGINTDIPDLDGFCGYRSYR